MFFAGWCCHMATKDLTYYFKHARPSSLPSSMSQATIDSMNRELSEYGVSQSNGPKRQGEYLKISAKEGAVIGEYAAKNSNAAAICHFKRNKEF